MMTLKTARQIARRVGAQIKEIDSGTGEYKVKLSIMTAKDPNFGCAEFFASSPRHAAHVAVMETAKACHALLTEAKQIYVDENLLFEG